MRAAALAFPAPADGPARVQAEADKDTSDRGKRALETAKVAGESGPGTRPGILRVAEWLASLVLRVMLLWLGFFDVGCKPHIHER